MHFLHLALWTCKMLCGRCHARYINFQSLTACNNSSQNASHPSHVKHPVDSIITVINIKVIHLQQGHPSYRGQAVDRIITVNNIKVIHPTGDRLLTQSLQWTTSRSPILPEIGCWQIHYRDQHQGHPSTSRSPILHGTGCWQNRYSEQHQGRPFYRKQAVDCITLTNIRFIHPTRDRLLRESLQWSTSRSSILHVDRLLTESLQWSTSRSPILQVDRLLTESLCQTQSVCWLPRSDAIVMLVALIWFPCLTRY